jgi:hypothetical protein
MDKKILIERFAEKLADEANQTLKDKESRIIYFASIGAALAFGLMIGILL